MDLGLLPVTGLATVCVNVPSPLPSRIATVSPGASAARSGMPSPLKSPTTMAGDWEPADESCLPGIKGPVALAEENPHSARGCNGQVLLAVPVEVAHCNGCGIQTDRGADRCGIESPVPVAQKDRNRPRRLRSAIRVAAAFIHDGQVRDAVPVEVAHRNGRASISRCRGRSIHEDEAGRARAQRCRAQQCDSRCWYPGTTRSLSARCCPCRLPSPSACSCQRRHSARMKSLSSNACGYGSASVPELRRRRP